MLKRVALRAVAAAAALAAGSTARADFVIDTFTTPDPAQTYSLAGAVGSTYTNTASLAGGITRTITVTQVGNNFGLAGSTSGFFGNTPVGGLFSLSTNAGATAFASLLYTYDTPQNLVGAGSSIQFTFNSVDQNTPFSVIISDGTVTASETGVVTNATLGVFSLPIDGFGVDLSNIVSIELLVNRNIDADSSTPEADVTLSEVRLTTPPSEPPVDPPVIPAPPALVLFAASAPALAYLRRRKA